MKRLLLALLLVSPLLRAADVARISDVAGFLPAETVRVVNDRLARFEQQSGVRVLIEFRRHSPSEAEDKVPGAFMHGLAKKLGLAERGVLAVYFADEPDWRLWIGDELTERFAGKKGSVAELTRNNAIHEAKEAVFAAAKARADAAEKDMKSPPHLVQETQALVDELIGRLQR